MPTPIIEKDPLPDHTAGHLPSQHLFEAATPWTVSFTGTRRRGEAVRSAIVEHQRAVQDLSLIRPLPFGAYYRRRVSKVTDRLNPGAQTWKGVGGSGRSRRAREQLRNEVTGNALQRSMSADTHGRSATGHTCFGAGSPRRTLASRRRAMLADQTAYRFMIHAGHNEGTSLREDAGYDEKC